MANPQPGDRIVREDAFTIWKVDADGKEYGVQKSKAGASKEKQDLFAREQELRQQAIQAAQDAAAATARGVFTTQQATAAGKQSLRASAAEALAGTLGQAGSMPTGGGQGAQLRQAALSSGIQQAQFGAGQAQADTEARQAAALARLEAARFEREAGDVVKDRAQRMEELRATINDIKKRHQGGIFETVDTDAIERELNQLAAGESDPVILRFIRQEIPGSYSRQSDLEKE